MDIRNSDVSGPTKKKCEYEKSPDANKTIKQKSKNYCNQIIAGETAEAQC